MGRWQKGESGNPSGRPKSDISLTKELRKQLGEVDPGTGKLNVEVIVAAMVRRGKRGEPNALQMIADRIDGKVAQQLNVEANMNVSREQRLAKITELLETLPADASTDNRVN